jgi:glycosyltransferase involved in cell wall biosynthesis
MCHNVESKCYRELLSASKKGIADVPHGTRMKAPLFRLWQSDGSIKLADHVVCLSTVDYEYIVNNLSCDRERITSQVNGVLSGDSVRRSETAPLKRVLFVGGWLDIKGKRLLPSIWSQVHARFPDATLQLIGTGVGEEVVLADFLPADRLSVTVIPMLDDEAEMLDQFSRHDVFLMPSLSEGSPLSLLEAMAAMMPTVAARVGGIPDIIKHEQDGLLFNCGEISDCVKQVCRLLSDSKMAGRLGRNARQRAAALSWTNSAKMLERAAESVLLQSSQRHKKSELPLSTGTRKS